ncbi:MAG: hydrolase, partial [Ilumatobacteraceae bacterium]|nr:hydrolase [Ilumatobacteraceae bacterium]
MWTANRKFTTGSMAVVFNDADEILCVRERFRDRGTWGLPGGYLKHRETHESNMRRELHEELKIDVPTVTFVAYYVQELADHFDALYTVTLDASMTPRAGIEIREVRWFAVDQLPPNL